MMVVGRIGLAEGYMIDWNRVAELVSEIGEDGFAEVVELFLDEVEGVVMRLSQSVDPGTLEQDMHFLKGGAWNLGFEDFGGHCQDGERLAAAGRAAEIDVQGVIDCYFASKTTFLTGLDARTNSGTSSAA